MTIKICTAQAVAEPLVHYSVAVQVINMQTGNLLDSV